MNKSILSPNVSFSASKGLAWGNTVNGYTVVGTGPVVMAFNEIAGTLYCTSTAKSGTQIIGNKIINSSYGDCSQTANSNTISSGMFAMVDDRTLEPVYRVDVSRSVRLEAMALTSSGWVMATSAGWNLTYILNGSSVQVPLTNTVVQDLNLALPENFNVSLTNIDGVQNILGNPNRTIDITTYSPGPAVSSAILTKEKRPTFGAASATGQSGVRFRYKIDDPNFTTGATETSLSTVTTPTDLNEGIHVIYVQELLNSGQWSAASSISLKIDLSPPTVPVVSVPISATNENSLIFRWETSTDGVGGSGVSAYNLEIGTSPGASDIFKGTLSGNSKVLERSTGGNLVTYYARVQAIDAAGNLSAFTSDFGGVRAFQATWVSGSNEGNEVGSYGTKGVPSPSNVPGARAEGVSWIDSSGNLWLFGGWGFGLSSSHGQLNDLWKFNGSEWTWVSGSNSINGGANYGTKGVAAPANVPGARIRSISWADASGNLWLFGGGVASGYYLYYLNDLWKFNGTNWTWVSGSNNPGQVGNYGTKGVAAASNIPGARLQSVSWIDSSGNLWLFGGGGLDNTSVGGALNDLWKFNGTNWTWVSGSNIAGQVGNYGTKGVVASSNSPGARYGSTSWTDASGNFWLFGGEGYGASSTLGWLNDLWKFNGTNWTWVSGSKYVGELGTYGTKGVAANSNTPGGRRNSISWVDSYGNFWLFGGAGYGATPNDGGLNDLWKFDGSNWTWISGSSDPGQVGTYGTKGVNDINNVPGARRGSFSWRDPSGILLLFGGEGSGASSLGLLNDLWKISP